MSKRSKLESHAIETYTNAFSQNVSFNGNTWHELKIEQENETENVEEPEDSGQIHQEFLNQIKRVGTRLSF